MKKLIAVFLFLSFFTANAFAYEDEGYWPRSYYAGLGFSAVATRGDIGNYTLNTKTEDGEKETVHLPSTNLFVSPDFILGVNIAQFSLALNYNYWYFTDNLAGFPETTSKSKFAFGDLASSSSTTYSGPNSSSRESVSDTPIQASKPT
jgi:hypothetical protein